DASDARNVLRDRVGMPHDGARVRGAPESPSLHPVSDARPANVCDERNGPVADLPVTRTRVVAWPGNVRVVDEERPAANVALRHYSPIPAVLRAIAIVAHHEIVIRRYDERSPIAERRLRGRRAEARGFQFDLVLPLEV